MMQHNQKPSYYFYLVGDGKEYRICRSTDHLMIAGASFRTKHAAIQDAKRHIAKLERGVLESLTEVDLAA